MAFTLDLKQPCSLKGALTERNLGMAKSAQTKEITRPYEAVIIMKADTAEEKQKSLFQKNKQIIESFKGSIHHVDTWGKRRLANAIHKEKTGLYFHTTFTATPQVVSELERTMRINDDVLRFVHTRLEEETDLNKYVQAFHDTLAANQIREKERQQERANKAPRQMRPSIG
jgi:small subunit ribosomal protein S6